MATLTVAPISETEYEAPRPLDSQPREPKPAPAPAKSTERGERLAQLGLLIVLMAAPALMCAHAACAADPDIWWHMRVGEWILQHHAVPRVEIFSRDLAGTPWLAYSWLFELMTIKIWQWFGVVGIVGYSVTMILAITVALQHLVRRLQTDFPFAMLLTYAACFSFTHLYTPRPWLFTILFFVLELDILMQVRRTGRTGELLWLPLIFALWANIHIEFIYGLFILGLAFVESVAARWGKADGTRVGPLAMGCALLAGLLATLANPFGWRLYSVVYNLVTQGGGLAQVSEMQAIPFRDLADYTILLLALGSVAALAWARRFRLFEVGVLLFAIVMAFRSQRDAWLVSVTAAAILAACIPVRKGIKAIQLPKFAGTFAAVMAACVVFVGFRAMKITPTPLNAQVANILPVKAAEAIQANHYAGPVYNDFNWGGYLIWALRMPVSIDGRTNLYGNKGMDRSIATWSANPDWATDKQLTSAGVVIGPAKAPLTQVLRLDPKFRLVYEDKLAAVFVAQKYHTEPESISIQ